MPAVLSGAPAPSPAGFLHRVEILGVPATPRKPGKTYYVTFCTRDRRVLIESERDVVMACCIREHKITCWLHCFVVMPDHVHLILTAYEDVRLDTVMQRIKSVSAHEVNRLRNRTGPVWQREYFDRILRSTEDVRVKAAYICENPVRAGLVARVEDYKWIWRLLD